MAIKDRIHSLGAFANNLFSFLVFTILDGLDFILCYVYKVADFFVEAEWKSCYCSTPESAISGTGKIIVSGQGEPKMVTKLQLDEISDTLFTRGGKRAASCSRTTVVQIPGRQQRHKFPIPRWSDCDCHTCTSWTSSPKESLFVKVDGAQDNAEEDVLFIHGFISTSAFWTETVYPNLSKSAKSKYRLISVDLLGFGRSPKPLDSLYTLREHVEMIQRSVIQPYKVKKTFHIVAHSLGCILAMALAVNHGGAVKSLTLLAPPYFPTPKGEGPAQYMMRRVAPRRVWPLIAFGASMACWYEHISRTICLVICKNHRIWEFIFKLLTRNRMRTYLMEGFFLHTHNAAWHTLHNVICGGSAKMEGYLEKMKNEVKCKITIYHGEDDELIPVECSYNLKSRIRRANIKVVPKKDHITIVVGRQKEFSTELEAIWNNAS